MVLPLLKRDMISCMKAFFIIFAVMCMYISVIIYMYNPEFADMLNDYQQALPEMMSVVGMTGIASNLLEWIQIYFYGFIMLLFPLVYIVILVQKLLMGYIDSGSMANLLATPNSRERIILTQAAAAMIWVTILIASVTLVGIFCSEMMFPGELDIKRYLILNTSMLLLQLTVCGIAFLAACIFSEAKHYYAVGAGIPILFFLLQMLSNMGEKMENLKYLTLYTLFPAEKIIQEGNGYGMQNLVLVLIVCLLFGGGSFWFTHRNLSL